MAVVQPNINSYTEKWEMPDKQIEKVRNLLQTHIGEIEWIYWLPETFLPRCDRSPLYGYSPMDRKLHQVLDTYGDAAIFGATTYDFQDAPNAYKGLWAIVTTHCIIRLYSGRKACQMRLCTTKEN